MRVRSLEILKYDNVYQSPTYTLRVQSVVSLPGKGNKTFDFASQTHTFVTLKYNEQPSGLTLCYA